MDTKEANWTVEDMYAYICQGVCRWSGVTCMAKRYDNSRSGLRHTHIHQSVCVVDESFYVDCGLSVCITGDHGQYQEVLVGRRGI